MQLLKLVDVLKILLVSKSHWYKIQEQPDAPKPIRLGPKTVRWYLRDIEQWVQLQAGKDWQK
ncbi:AlpA family phage regulatory protein [Arsukibacterium perlucidum]|uniref:helix-turn-helix transcriptional regulator n=1 Tax=Arsukibacterium perlucidum TaxID=368811 RepID=UPI00035C1272